MELDSILLSSGIIGPLSDAVVTWEGKGREGDLTDGFMVYLKRCDLGGIGGSLKQRTIL